MTENSTEALGILIEMRDLLRLMAEPAIAARDSKLREALRGLAGSLAGKKAKAILLMDGSRTQANIVKECGIDKGDLSGLVKKLTAANLLTADVKQPKLTISIPSNFFEQGEKI
jgi:DNA-binding MarR family transcriptional regulator